MTNGPATISPAAEIARLAEEVTKSGRGPSEDDLTKIARELAKLFSVKQEEVAVLELSANGAILKFLKI